MKDSIIFNGALFFKFCLSLLLIAGVMVPSDGDHGILSLKSVAFLLTAFSWIVYLIFNPKLSGSVQKLFLFFCGALSFFILWSLVGVRNEEQTFAQFKVFIITLFATTAIIFAFKEKIFSFSQFLKLLLIASFSYSAGKVFLGTLHFLGIINLLGLMEKLGIRFMSMAILGNIGRLQTSVDVLTPFILFFLLTSQDWGLKLPRWFKTVFVVISWLSIGLSFSRFLLFCAFLSHVAFWFTEKKKPLAISILKALAILFIIVMGAGPQRVGSVIEKRFFSKDVSHSDEVREFQINALLEGFEESPYIGKGIGGYSEKAVRDPRLKFSYEVQWISFLMQFGVIGIVLLVTPFLFMTYLILRFPLSRLKTSLFLIFSLWLFAGFTNPFLISLTSGIIYALFYGAADFTNREDHLENDRLPKYTISS